MSKQNIFLIAGRTGGPFFPLPTIAKVFDKYEPVYIGVKNGFEEQAVKKLHSKIEFLPDVRLTILSFKKEKISETIANYFKFVYTFIKFIFALFKGFYLLIKYRPRMIYSTGSFLSIPISLAMQFSNLLGFTDTKLIVHQQDPDPGLSNRICAPWADRISCVFEYTKSKYSAFKNAILVPNPIDQTQYLFDENSVFSDSSLSRFFNQQSNKPTLLIFGGGSGSEDINIWTVKNTETLLSVFRIVHLTGVLQKKALQEIQNQDYLRLQVVLEDMKLLLYKSDLVICRAGMASITELTYLQKPAYLVPLPSSHQEQNAELVSDKFFILHQKDRQNWIETIFSSYPSFFESRKEVFKDVDLSAQEKYFASILKLVG